MSAHVGEARATGAIGQGSGLSTARAPQPKRAASREGKPTLLWDFHPPGPVAGAFINDLRTTTMLVGPLGSGKTIASMFKSLILAQRQPRSIIDGVRKCKVYHIGKDYKAIWDKVIEAHGQVWPRIQGMTTFRGGRGEDAVYTIALNDPKTIAFDGHPIGRIELVHQFVALANVKIEDWAKGLKGTGYYLYEMDTLPEEVLDACLSRLWRYADDEWPDEYGEDNLPPSCVWGDLNAPVHGNWLYSKYWGVDNSDFKMYIQPSGLAPNAENVKNKGRIYWVKLAETFRRTGDDWKVDRFIHVKPGFDRTGKPVFTQYQPHLHRLVDNVEGDSNLPLVIGVDQGSTPAAVFMQPWPNGVVHVLSSIACPNGEQWTYKDLGERISLHLAQRYPGYAAVLAPDPQAFAVEPGREDGQPWAMSLAAECGMIGLVRPHSNLIDDRLKPTREKLQALADDGKPKLRINPECVSLNDGFLSGYRLKRIVSTNGEERFVPDKLSYVCHEMDACMYGTMVCLKQPEALHDAMASVLKRLNHQGFGAGTGYGGGVTLIV
ncbi:MAG: hypothetical protein AAGF20_00395 [Pseudomonadota bacterium]